jgi:glycosyltransferase involved in cell wall biosynthesis
VNGLHVFKSPRYLPVSGSKWLASFTQDRWFEAVRKAAHEIGITKPVLWISRPELLRAVGRFGESLSIYHIVDEYGGYTKQNATSRQLLWQDEQSLMDAVDMSIAVSPELIDSRRGPGRDVVLIENAVDAEKFETARYEMNIPKDLSTIRKPILGYSGLISKRLDLPLLQRLASQHPRWSVVLVGKVDRRNCEEELKALEQYDNVHFLGQKEVDEISNYVAGMDIGLLPYELNLETQNISPLKMYEYLAAGLPVVSSRIPAASRHADIVSVAETTDEFIRKCESFIGGDDQVTIDRRITFARGNTWDHRVEQISDLMGRKLNEKYSPAEKTIKVQT